MSHRARTRGRRRRGAGLDAAGLDGATAAVAGDGGAGGLAPAGGQPEARVGRPQREILVSFEDDEPKCAIFEGQRLVEVDLERTAGRRIVGNIYKGRVQNVLPGMQAAFVDIGLERNAFLFVDDAHPGGALTVGDDVPEDLPPRGAASITDLVHPGQEILVQVVKEPFGQKGARVTRGLTLPGRYVVLMPGTDYAGISRRIADHAERDRLRGVANRIRGNVGVIVRTAAEGADGAELESDCRLLLGLWQEIWERARQLRAPAVVHRDLDVVQRMVRDQLNGDVQRIVVDRPEGFARLATLLQTAAPALAGRLEQADPAQARIGLFAARGVEGEVEQALGRRVDLPSGAYLVIDQTEALTAIDVNTGRYTGSAARANLEETFVAANLEAATEIARQIRLRGIGGIIVVDFIDMELAADQRRVLEALEVACRPDPNRPQVLGITALGLVEMTRKKARQSLRELMTRPCATCDGQGRVLSEETISRRIRREIQTALRTSPEAEAILVETHPVVASILIGTGGEALRALEQQTGRTIFIRGAADCGAEQMTVRALGDRGAVETQARPVHEGQVLELEVQEPHVTAVHDGIARVDGYVVDIEGGAARVGKRVKVEIVRAFRTYAKAKLV